MLTVDEIVGGTCLDGILLAQDETGIFWYYVSIPER